MFGLFKLRDNFYFKDKRTMLVTFSHVFLYVDNHFFLIFCIICLNTITILYGWLTVQKNTFQVARIFVNRTRWLQTEENRGRHVLCNMFIFIFNITLATLESIITDIGEQPRANMIIHAKYGSSCDISSSTRHFWNILTF